MVVSVNIGVGFNVDCSHQICHGVLVIKDGQKVYVIAVILYMFMSK